MKYYITLLFLLFAAIGVKAQDVLYLRDGSTMEVKVKKIDGSLIYYSANPGAPQRYIAKKKVEKIVYERGREQVFKENTKHKQSLADAHNVLTLAPVNLLAFGRGSGLAIGLDYERFLGESHRLSLRIPIYAGITTTDDPEYDYDPYLDGVIIWTAPGIRYHWLKPMGKADLATGISFVVGNVNETYYPNDGFGTPNTDRQYLTMGITLDNDFTLYSTRKIAFGVHTAFGPVLGEDGDHSKWMVQIGLKIGRKF